MLARGAGVIVNIASIGGAGASGEPELTHRPLLTSSSQKMSLEELEHSLHSGGVYRVIPGATGIPDSTI
jgi:hypothetical protein